jgi:hypothetical protein
MVSISIEGSFLRLSLVTLVDLLCFLTTDLGLECTLSSVLFESVLCEALLYSSLNSSLTLFPLKINIYITIYD